LISQTEETKTGWTPLKLTTLYKDRVEYNPLELNFQIKASSLSSKEIVVAN